MILNNKNLKILDFISNKICSTRKELSQKLNISEAAVGKRVKYLLEKDYIILDKNKNKKTFGRTAIGLKINNKLGEILGIYFAQDEINFGVSDIDGKLLKTSKIKIIDNKEIEKLCFMEIEKYILNYKILIVGIAMNGITDHKNGICIYSASYNWNQKNIKKILEKKYNIPVYVDNGMNIMAYYEKKRISININSFVIVKIESGVGASFFFDGKIHRGKDFGIGEIGHIPFDTSNNAILCCCGGKGCFETILSDWAIEKKVEDKTGKKYKINEIILRANKNEKIFKNLILELIPIYLNIIFWISTLINPEKIIFYGQISECGDFFWKELNRKIKEGKLNKGNFVDIISCSFNNEMVVKGAIFLALENLFKNN